MTNQFDILNYDRDELSRDFESALGLQPFRARQVIPWIYRERVTSFSPMTDISMSVREELSKRYRISRPVNALVQLSKDGTRKYLFEMGEGMSVESVLICQPKRFTLCISSQVGCAIGCKFCKTATMGLKRHLSSGEILSQVLAVRDDISSLEHSGKPVEFNNIVFMGMGEPFHNIENVIRAVKVLNDPLGLNFSGRKITVSTSGLVPAIKRFGESGAQANLAISLNATTDEVRTAIMPINKRWPISALLGALREYPLKRGRRITIEYVMLGGLNDTPEDMRRLPALLHGIPVKVNLIPYNANTGLGFKSPTRETIDRFQAHLLQCGLNATVRWSKGEDISAACGQLATTVQ